MKFFSRTPSYLSYHPNTAYARTSSTNFTFTWLNQTLNPVHSNLINQYTLLISSSSYLPITTYCLNSNVQNHYFWTNLSLSLHKISKTHSPHTIIFKHLTNSFYVNQTMSQFTNSQFFYVNRINLQNNTTINDHLQFRSTVNQKKTHLTLKQPTFDRLLVILSKYLPHINLVRLFRRTKNKKTLNFNVDKTSFFKNTLIRINSDYKFFSLNTLKALPENSNSRKSFSLFIRSLCRDNLLESKLDLTLINVRDSFNYSPFPNPFSTQFQSRQLTNNRSTWSWTKLSSLSVIMFDFINIHTILNQPLLYKYLFWLVSPNTNVLNNLTHSLTSLNDHSFSTRINLFKTTNIWPSSFFHFTLKRKVLKIFSFNKFLPNVTMWYYNILIRFMESCTGKKVFLKFNPFIENFLSFTDIARCNMWSIRINSFQKLLGPKVFLNESLRIMHIALRFKDPTFFANWIKSTLNKMSFWKYRLLFRYIKFAMRYLFWLYFSELQFKGLKIKLKGKISVAGNARTRTLVYRIGETGYSTIDNRVLCDSSIINTFTGVLGFKIWFFF